MRTLVAQAPAVVHYCSTLAGTHWQIGILLATTGDSAGALAEHRELVRALAAGATAVAVHRGDLAAAHERIGTLLAAAGRPAEARAEFDQARPLLEALATASPKSPTIATGLPPP